MSPWFSKFENPRSGVEAINAGYLEQDDRRSEAGVVSVTVISASTTEFHLTFDEKTEETRDPTTPRPDLNFDRFLIKSEYDVSRI